MSEHPQPRIGLGFLRLPSRTWRLISIFIVTIGTVYMGHRLFASEHPKENYLSRLLADAAPGAVVALIIYWTVEDGVSLLAGLVQVETRKPEEVIERLRTARREINIHDTFISTLINYRNGLFFDALKGAIDRGVEIKILLLSPDSNAARQRSEDLRYVKADLVREMEEGLRSLYELWATIDEEKRKLLNIRVYNSTPIVVFIHWDSAAYISLLPADQSSDTEENLLVSTRTPLFSYVAREFKDLWDKEERTHSLASFLHAELLRPNLPPATLFCAGELGVHWPPQYIAFRYQDPVESFLDKKTIDQETTYLRRLGTTSAVHVVARVRQGDPEYASAVPLIRARYGSAFPPDSSLIYKVRDVGENDIRMSEQRIVDIVQKNGFAVVPGATFRLSPDPEFLEDWKLLFQAWDRLDGFCEDKYLKKASEEEGIDFGVRLRRFGKFVLDCDNGNIRFLGGDTEFVQSRNYGNSCVDRRILQPIDSKLGNTNRFLRALIRADFASLVPERDRLGQWHVQIHLFRVYAHGFPSPEGRHSDQHLFLAIHVIRRENITGGVTRVIDPSGDEQSFVLEGVLDTVFVDDSRMRHCTSEVCKNDPLAPGFRDVLVVDFDRFSEPVKSAPPAARKALPPAAE